MQSIYLFESRNPVYLPPLVKRAKELGFNPIVIPEKSLEGNHLFEEFANVYKHYSQNSREFEISCFARYFAIAPLLTNNDNFLITDTDIYLSKKFQQIKDVNVKDTYVGSEGYKDFGSEEQISNHFSIWNRDLLYSYISFLIEKYKDNYDKDFFNEYYQKQTDKLKKTAVSDMNLLYFWIKEKGISFLNSNSSSFPVGIDHNISEKLSADKTYKMILGRKMLEFDKKGSVNCIYDSGVKQEMALLHFQGGYKRILVDFYKYNKSKFRLFTTYIYLGRTYKSFMKK